MEPINEKEYFPYFIDPFYFEDISDCPVNRTWRLRLENLPPQKEKEEIVETVDVSELCQTSEDSLEHD